MATHRVDTVIVDDLDGACELAADWDRLAVEAQRPLVAPALGLAWWRHCASTTELRIVAVRRNDSLVGLAPYCAQRLRLGRADYRLLGSGLFHRIGPVAEEGEERTVAAEVARALHDATPTPTIVSLEGIPSSPPWGSLLAAAYPGRRRPRRYTSSVHPAPVVRPAGLGFDAWLATKSRNFRQQMRSYRRRATAQGVTWRRATAESLDADVQALVRLHRLRWPGPSGGVFGDPGVEHALRDAARELLPDDRFRLWLVERDGTPLAAQLFAAAGGEVAYWNGGWDPGAAALRPGLLAMLAAIEDACARGEHRLDLGGGSNPYKLRFADGDDPISFGGLMPRARHYMSTRAQLLPHEVRWHTRRLAKQTLRRA